MQWKHRLTTSMKSSGSRLFGLIWMISMVPAVISYDKIFMGHATIKPGYNFVCHQRTIFNTLGGQIDSRKEYYESGLIHCSILITSPPGTLIDFRFTEINIIASNLNTCEDASLRIYDGSPDGSPNGTSLLLGFPNGICGQAVPSFTIRSTTNSMYLQLMVTSPYTSTFSAIYTAYSPRTSILCFYCGDLCLQGKEQLCDGLNNCRDAEDETLHECTKVPEQPPGPTRNQYDEDVKLILVFVFACTSFIFLFIIIALLLKSRLCGSCVEKRRQRRAIEAADMMLHPYANRTASGNSIPPVSLGPNRPFMAGPTVPTSSRPGASTARLAPRSDMPPPYSAVPTESEIRVHQQANDSRTTVVGATEVQRSDLQEQRHAVNDDIVASNSPAASNSQVVESQPRNTAIGGEETSFTEDQTPNVVSVNDSQQSEESQSEEIHQISDSTNVSTGTIDDPVHLQQVIELPNRESSTQAAVGISKSEESIQKHNTSPQSITSTSSFAPVPDSYLPEQSVQCLPLSNTGNPEQSLEAGHNDINRPPKSTNQSVIPENAVTSETEGDARNTGNPVQLLSTDMRDADQSPKAADNLALSKNVVTSGTQIDTHASTLPDTSSTDSNQAPLSNADISTAGRIDNDANGHLTTPTASGFQTSDEESAAHVSKRIAGETSDSSNAPSKSCSDENMQALEHVEGAGLPMTENKGNTDFVKSDSEFGFDPSPFENSDVSDFPPPVNEIDNTHVEGRFFRKWS